MECESHSLFTTRTRRCDRPRPWGVSLLLLSSTPTTTLARELRSTTPRALPYERTIDRSRRPFVENLGPTPDAMESHSFADAVAVVTGAVPRSSSSSAPTSSNTNSSNSRKEQPPLPPSQSDTTLLPTWTVDVIRTHTHTIVGTLTINDRTLPPRMRRGKCVWKLPDTTSVAPRFGEHEKKRLWELFKGLKKERRKARKQNSSGSGEGVGGDNSGEDDEVGDDEGDGDDENNSNNNSGVRSNGVTSLSIVDSTEPPKFDGAIGVASTLPTAATVQPNRQQEQSSIQAHGADETCGGGGGGGAGAMGTRGGPGSTAAHHHHHHDGISALVAATSGGAALSPLPTPPPPPPPGFGPILRDNESAAVPVVPESSPHPLLAPPPPPPGLGAPPLQASATPIADRNRHFCQRYFQIPTATTATDARATALGAVVAQTFATAVAATADEHRGDVEQMWLWYYYNHRDNNDASAAATTGAATSPTDGTAAVPSSLLMGRAHAVAATPDARRQQWQSLLHHRAAEWQCHGWTAQSVANNNYNNTTTAANAADAFVLCVLTGMTLQTTGWLGYTLTLLLRRVDNAASSSDSHSHSYCIFNDILTLLPLSAAPNAMPAP